MTKKEKRFDEIMVLLAEEIIPKLDTLRAERRAFKQYPKASAELERLAHVLRAYEWTDHRAKVARKEARSPNGNTRLTKHVVRRNEPRARLVSENNEVDVQQTQRDRELKKGGKVTRMEEEAKELGKVVIKLRIQADIE